MQPPEGGQSLFDHDPELFAAFNRFYGTLWTEGDLDQAAKEVGRIRNARVGCWTWDSENTTIQFNESHHNMTPLTNNKARDGAGFDLDRRQLDGERFARWPGIPHGQPVPLPRQHEALVGAGRPRMDREALVPGPDLDDGGGGVDADQVPRPPPGHAVAGAVPAHESVAADPAHLPQQGLDGRRGGQRLEAAAVVDHVAQLAGRDRAGVGRRVAPLVDVQDAPTRLLERLLRVGQVAVERGLGRVVRNDPAPAHGDDAGGERDRRRRAPPLGDLLHLPEPRRMAPRRGSRPGPRSPGPASARTQAGARQPWTAPWPPPKPSEPIPGRSYSRTGPADVRSRRGSPQCAAIASATRSRSSSTAGHSRPAGAIAGPIHTWIKPGRGNQVPGRSTRRARGSSRPRA